MLKALNTSQTLQLVDKKCAEIFFRKENCFTIICTHCELKTFNFEEYLLHFKNVHLTTCSSLQSNTNIETVEIKIEGGNDFEETVDNEFSTLIELQEVPFSNSTNSSSPFVTNGKIISDVLEERNEWLYDEETVRSDEELSNPGSEHMPRILKPGQQKSLTAAEFTCKECSKSYKFVKNLERHIKKCHNEELQYLCVRCKQTFPDERSLNVHLRKKHAGFPCGECEKVYSSKEALNIHQYKHTGVRGFHCSIEGCGKSFFNPKQLSMHTRYVHRLEKNFVCEICGFRTKGQPALIVHKRSHTGEKPFVCNLCSKAFASKSLLCEHEPSHSSERPHVCDVCGRAFARPKALYHHKHLHLGIKKFVCKLCGRAFAQMAGLAGHMRQHKADNC